LYVFKVYIEGFEESTRLKGAGWAQAPIGFAVSATRDVNVVEHKKFFFSPLDLLESARYAATEAKSLSSKDLHGKSGKQRR